MYVFRILYKSGKKPTVPLQVAKTSVEEAMRVMCGRNSDFKYLLLEIFVQRIKTVRVEIYQKICSALYNPRNLINEKM